MSGRPHSEPPSVARRVAVLGGLGVRPMIRLSLPGRRILAYLAVKSHTITRALASAELWPDLPEEAGRANLRRGLWHVPRGWIGSVADDLSLEASSDYAEAQDSAARAIAGQPLSLAEIRLLKEDLLPGWHEEWAMEAQQSFRLLRVQALETACRTMASHGEHALATQAGAAALSAEPLRESAAEALIEAHLAQGNRFEAVQCFRGLSARLQAELGVDPDPELAERLTPLAVAGGRH